MEILNRYTGKTIHELTNAKSIVDVVNDAIKNKISLKSANLEGTNLEGADLKYANLEDAKIFAGWKLTKDCLEE